MSLVGSFGGSAIALIAPPIIYILYRRALAMETQTTVPIYVYIIQSIVIMFGIVGFATGTYSSVKAIIEAF
jgi:hypothetical protein